MNRHILLQELVSTNDYTSYCEIGTFQGCSFLPLRCKVKLAVDPEFKIPKIKKLMWLFKNPYNIRNKYFQMKSEVFFREEKKYLEKINPIDLFFIDGMHSFKASLIDVLNSLPYLSKNGLIIMHDCYPPHKPAATPANSAFEARMMNKETWKGDWCGDVWKTMAYLKENYRSKLEIFTINADFGLGVIKVLHNDLDLKINPELFERINKMRYEELIEDPQRIINLRPYCSNEISETFSK